MTDPRQNDIEIEPLSDEALEEVAGGTDRAILGSDGPSCCSDSNCSNSGT
ncbi:MAG TPA: hypothetical protein VHG91_06140 [Longimicrobium sp.]|nr:hypothetical protein [Longimicrobium sp.]